jgi:hypothetical protein
MSLLVKIFFMVNAISIGISSAVTGDADTVAEKVIVKLKLSPNSTAALSRSLSFKYAKKAINAK